ncbi:MAG: hypothetical protein QXU34_01815 [Ignisphaera sp.]
MFAGSRSLITASVLPLIQYVTSIRGIRGFREILSIRKCSEVRNVVKHYLNYIKFLESKRSKIIVTPTIGIAPYIATLEHFHILPSTILAFVKRAGHSNTFRFKLFLEDIEICMEDLNRMRRDALLNKLIRNIAFIYDPIAFNEVIAYSIPMIIAFDVGDLISNTFPDVETNIFNIEFENFTALRKDNEYTIFVLSGNTKDVQNSGEELPISEFHIYNTCSPLICLNDLEGIDIIYRFDALGVLIDELLQRGEGSHLYIEFWSSYAIYREYSSNSKYYYIWIPYANWYSVKQLIKFMVHSNLYTSLKKVSIVSPFKIFAELGNISTRRIWLSTIIEQIVHENNAIKIELVA